MRFLAVTLATLVATLVVTPALGAVHLAQAPNAFDRTHERLPDLRVVRGATPKTTTLAITADADEAWTVTWDVPWLEVIPASGTGPATVRLRFDGAGLALLDDPSGHVTVSGPGGGTNTEILDVRVDLWPSLATPATRAELIAYAKDPANWPADGFGGAWELWGFIPDDYADVDGWERTPCAPGQSGDDCVRDGQAGLAAGQSADQAWLLSTGDPRVVVAELDSGIRWSERSLINKFYLNARELDACPPPGADTAATDPFAGFDVNDDGVFNIRDYDDATWVTDVNGNGHRDPQDLIWADDGNGPCTDGLDADGNGYTDDISGWDFYWNDNDPSDDADFGHGTGEANDSTAEAHDGDGAPGICMRCMVMPVRVGDSFVLDVNQFADGVIFAVESGADLVQEALGSINNTPYSQWAINWAYRNNVPIIASAADETSYHHNFPGSLDHTIYVHAIQQDEDHEEDSTTFLNFNNCTNFGGHLSLSTPGEGCSSEATGKTSGQAALIKSYFLQERDRAAGSGDEAYFAPDLTAEEMYQVLVASADDIDVPGAETDDAALSLQKFPSNEGWDLHFGYGRNNARRSLELVRDRKIPPEADVALPRWFEVFDPARVSSFDVVGSVASPRLTNLRWTLSVAEGVIGKSFTEVASGTGAVAEGLLGTVSLAPEGPLGSLVVRSADPAGADPEQFTATLLLEVIGTNPAGDDVRGVFRKTFGVRTDPTTLPGFPIYLGASGESSPRLTDLDGDGREEIVVATADGQVHAIMADGTELPGFPAALGAYPALSSEVCGMSSDPRKCHRNARPFRDGTAGGIDPDSVRQSLLATIAVADLDGDSCRDIVAATLDGYIYVIDCDGQPKDGFPVEMDRTLLADGTDGARRCLDAGGTERIGCRSSQQHGESGFFSSPALADLDGDGSLEIVIGGMDAHAYAWHHDGTLVNGWPVPVEHPTQPEYEDDGEINRYEDRIVASPAICDLFGDGRNFVVLGTTERLENQANVFLYAISPQGTADPNGPFPPGWPTTVTGFIPDEILPYIGRGNPNSPACADFDGDGMDEVVNAGMGGNMVLIHEDGTYDSMRDVMNSTSEFYGPNATTDETFSLPVINNPSVADVNGDGYLDIVNGTAGSGLIAVASQGGKRNSFDHSVSVWDSDNLAFLDGFPHRVWDYQFFMNYSVADLDGTGTWNVIMGDGGYFVYAPNASGEEAAGFPKWTQQWHIATPTVGDLDGDERIDVVANSREGWLWAWRTDGHVGGPPDQKLPAIQWEGFHHDDLNSGNYGGPLKPYPRLLPADDGCGCDHAGNRASPAAGALALVALAGTLVGRRRVRRG